MSVLPSPIPHPFEFCPWDLPGWVYEALDWAVGVEWPEGDERATWDLADQWYEVAGSLAVPYADATAAAGEVLGGYGGRGADAFAAAWRRLAEGGDAPMPVLVAVANDLGRLVEECGCDIEGAKLEVWIELGILAAELLALAVATVLTAGAASPAAGAAIAATRIVVQQIFRRLIAQLARKTLKHGVQEAGERAAKQVAKDGAKGLARRAAWGGLAEAGEEAGAGLAIQGHQNSTGRRHGLDAGEIGTSALGGLAGGAVAPLAGLGRHASGRFGRVGEHFSREMGGEVLAEAAAKLATGNGLVSLEDAARAAASGATGSATAQTDAALQARLDGRLNALAGTTYAPVDLSARPPLAEIEARATDLTAPPADPVRSTDPVVHIPAQREGLLSPPVDEAGVVERPASDVDHPEYVGGRHRDLADAGSGSSPAPEIRATVGPPGPPVPPTIAAAGDADRGATAVGDTGRDALSMSRADRAAVPHLTDVALASPTTPVAAAVAPALSSVVADPMVASSHLGPMPTTEAPPMVGGTTSSTNQATAVGAATPDPGPTVRAQSSRFPLLEALDPGPPRRGPEDAPLPPAPPPTDPAVPLPRRPDSYSKWREADREALDRRRYQGYFEAQRAWFEEKRRLDEAGRLRDVASGHEARARRYAEQALELQRSGRVEMAKWSQNISRRELLDCFSERDLAEAVLAGTVVPERVDIDDEADFRRINDDVADLAPGAVETGDHSALTGDDHPPSSDHTRPYGRSGGLRPPLALHQTDLERAAPRVPDGRLARTPDPRMGKWFGLVNDGGPRADATRAINCLDCTLSLYETWVHGRPRVSAPRTFDSYHMGDISRPLGGEVGGPGRVEEVTGGRYQRLCPDPTGLSPAQVRRAVHRGYVDIHDQLIAGGHGSYAFLITSWENGASHAWVAMNQNGMILFADPQNSAVEGWPLYHHSGVANEDNVVGIDALILGADGKPMPIPDRPAGLFSARPPLSDAEPEPDADQDELYLNRMYLLDDPQSPTGALPSSESDSADPPASVRVDLTLGEWSALEALRGGAEEAADEVETVLEGIGRSVADTLRLETPVVLRDQRYRVKSLDSLARKFHDEAEAEGVSVAAFSERVNDVLRFSYAMPEGSSYAPCTGALLAELTRSGYTVEDSDCKNFWRKGNRFYGFNCTVRTPNGLLFELQLHTDSSRRAWLETHDYYEILRRDSEEPVRRVDALLRMLAVNRRHGMPGAVPDDLTPRFPAKDSTFAKWVSGNPRAWREFREWLEATGKSFQRVARELGLTADDFPIADNVASQLEPPDADLLRNLSD